MAKVVGAGHSDFVKGQVGGTCFRGYRGSNIVSCSRRMTRAKPKQSLLNSPLELKKLFDRWVASSGVTLRSADGFDYVSKWVGQKGKFSPAVASATGRQPKWIAADIDRNGKPYVLPDGVDDCLFTGQLTPALVNPFEVWMVASEQDISSGVKRYLGTRITAGRGVGGQATPSVGWRMYIPTVLIVALLGDLKVKVWRWLYNGAASWLEWNGKQQKPEVDVAAAGIDKLHFFADNDASSRASFKCFDLMIFDAILSSVERGQLLRWCFDEYNLPA